MSFYLGPQSSTWNRPCNAKGINHLSSQTEFLAYFLFNKDLPIINSWCFTEEITSVKLKFEGRENGNSILWFVIKTILDNIHVNASIIWELNLFISCYICSTIIKKYIVPKVTVYLYIFDLEKRKRKGASGQRNHTNSAVTTFVF